MRKEASNTFVDGLIQDLNPIDTPNTVLTDNLNGTIITYNGNEFSLQNDRGNHALKHCKLKPNYIPVGVKEYADTIYIVSYNPIDKTTEIGSYPSPLEIDSSTNSGDVVTIESVIKQSETIPNYTDLIQKAKMHVFSDDEFKIYPGDEYQLNIQDESKYIYEELEYYIIDENRNKYNITKQIKENSNFHPAGWTVPGWMAVQYKLAAFEDFQMNIRSFEVPLLASESSGKLNLNFQLKISDNLLLNRLPYNHLDEIGLSVKITNDNKNLNLYSEDLLFDDINGKFIEWYESSKILWAQKEIELSQLNQGDKLTITATPFIQITVDDRIYKVVYDNFTENLNESLTNIGSFSDFSIATDIWKFWVEDDDDQRLYLEFDIKGPVVTNKTVDLYYKATKLNETKGVYHKLDYYTGIGQNMISIPFDDDLKPEDIYIIEFIFTENDPNTWDVFKDIDNKYHYSVKKLVIASQIFSKFVPKYNNFDNIEFDEWASEYDSSIKNDDSWSIDVNSRNNFIREYTKGIVDNSGLSNIDIHDNLKYFWKTTSSLKNYNHTAFVKENDWYDIDGTVTNFLRGYYTSADVKINTSMSSLNGGLWSNVKRNAVIKIKSYDEILSASSCSLSDIKNKFELTVQPIIATKCEVSYDKITPGIVRGSASHDNCVETINNNGIKYGILTGANKKSGLNWYITTGFRGVNEDLPTDPNKYIKTTDNVHGSGSKSSIPNDTTKAIVSFMTRNNIQFFVMFVATRPSDDDKSVGLKKGSELLFNSGGNSVYMQPFVVFRNKQNNPIYFPIDGYEPYYFRDSDYSGAQHGIQFSEWPLLSDFVKHMHDSLGDFVRYDIKDLSDGFFIKAVPVCDDSVSELNINVDLDISDVTEWIVQDYNILSFSDRQDMSSLLIKNNVTFGKLLNGAMSRINGKTINAIEYNKKFTILESTKQALNDLIDSINNISDSAVLQWDKWRTDSLYKESDKLTLNGITSLNDNIHSEKFKQSELFKLMQQSDSGSSLTIGATGDHLIFEVVKGGGGSINQDASYHVGLIHSTITFP